MSEPLDELYFNWLYRQVADPEHINPSYWRLMKLLYTKEFIYIVGNDEDRSEDGKELRYEFIRDDGLVNVDHSWMRLGCTLLALLIGLSRRLAFEAEGEPSIWFWVLLGNLGLAECDDSQLYPDHFVSEVLDRVIWRTYTFNGEGGIFPLKHPQQDQRRLEMWYQLQAYVLEL